MEENVINQTIYSELRDNSACNKTLVVNMMNECDESEACRYLLVNVVTHHWRMSSPKFGRMFLLQYPQIREYRLGVVVTFSKILKNIKLLTYMYRPTYFDTISASSTVKQNFPKMYSHLALFAPHPRSPSFGKYEETENVEFFFF